MDEVSTINDETEDTFHDHIGCFTNTEEDTEPVHLLVNDYRTWLE